MSDKKVSSFDVMKAMSEENLDIRFAALDNVTAVNYYKKRGTEFTIGFPGNLCFDFQDGKFGGGMILFNMEQFKATKKRLEDEHDANPLE